LRDRTAKEEGDLPRKRKEASMIYKRAKWYHMDDTFNGVRYRLPLKTKNWQEALNKEKEEIAAIKSGKRGRKSTSAPGTLPLAVAAYLEYRKLHSAPKTHTTDRERSRSLIKFFRDIRLRRINADGIADYQANRSASGISGRTINLEVGLLRRVLKHFKHWGRLADDVQLLPETPKEARVLTPEEKQYLQEVAASNPAWQVARCAAVLALNTTMRGCELRGLRWRDVDLFDTRTLYIYRKTTKTKGGVRAIPLNRDAVLALSELWDRAQKLGSDKPDCFVFPACESGHIDPSKPMKGWRRAWRSLTKSAGLKGLRFNDLRHYAVTELAEMGLSDQTIMSIAGHVIREMLDHYSHIRLTAKRKALEGLESPLPNSALPSSDNNAHGLVN
jgi:integrase